MAEGKIVSQIKSEGEKLNIGKSVIVSRSCMMVTLQRSLSNKAAPTTLAPPSPSSLSHRRNVREWQKALYSVGGSEVNKWPLQLRRSAPDGMVRSSNGTSLQQEQEMSYSGHSKGSSFVKGGGLGQSSARKQLMCGPPILDHNRGLLQWVQNISFITISVDHSLHLIFQADSASPGTQGA